MKIKVVIENKGKEKDITPHVKDILTILAAGGVLTALVVAPGLAQLLPRKKYPEYEESNDRRWKQFNIYLLRRDLKRLRKNKDLKIVYEKGIPYYKLTKKGMFRAHKYRLADLALKPSSKWDKKWRLIIYDIPDEKKAIRDEIRHLLTKMQIFQLQKSVYLTPHPCEEEMEFVREFYRIGEHVKVLTVSGLEDEKDFRDYFGV